MNGTPRNNIKIWISRNGSLYRKFTCIISRSFSSFKSKCIWALQFTWGLERLTKVWMPSPCKLLPLKCVCKTLSNARSGFNGRAKSWTTFRAPGSQRVRKRVLWKYLRKVGSVREFRAKTAIKDMYTWMSFKNLRIRSGNSSLKMSNWSLIWKLNKCNLWLRFRSFKRKIYN